METAEALDMSEANVKVTLHRARRIMRCYEKNRVSNFSRRVEEMRDTLQRFSSRLASGEVQGLKKMQRLHFVFAPSKLTELT